MATLADLAADNENIQSQLQEWAAARSASREATDDWGAFRQHLLDLGAPDPGEEAPEDFGAAS